jgi:hypothetical protein
MKKSEFAGIESILDSLVEQGIYYIATNVSHENKDDGSEFHLRIYQATEALHNNEELQDKDEALIAQLAEVKMELQDDDNMWFELDIPKDTKYRAGFREFHNRDGRYFKLSLSDYGIYVSYYLSAF